MPNFDGGQYFLTVLAPVKNDKLVLNGAGLSSPVHVLRQRLEQMPTALQTRVTQQHQKGVNSPFARNTRTHFARLVVIDDAAYNGREPPTTLYSTVAGLLGIAKVNPVIAQKADRLSCPYLLFVADFDAASGGDSELDGYLALLWETMGAELRDVFEFCFKFDKVASAADFTAYIKKCQIETTMPFHDYWEGGPQLQRYKVAKWKLVAPLLPAALAGMIFLGVLLAHAAKWLAKAHWKLPSVGLPLAIALVLGIGGAWLLLRLIAAWSLRPFPEAPNSTLPHVLKALYLQRQFSAFAIGQQGRGGASQLHEAFGAFLEAHDPAALSGPATQAPGIIP